jgi:hypothetical protein
MNTGDSSITGVTVLLPPVSLSGYTINGSSSNGFQPIGDLTRANGAPVSADDPITAGVVANGAAIITGVVGRGASSRAECIPYP